MAAASRPDLRPGRPTGTGRDSRAELFLAAAREFAERGYDAAGVDRIAAKARLNKAMLYYHFGSKLRLYHEVLDDMFRTVGRRARTIADGPGNADEKLAAWIGTIVEEAGERPWFPPIMLREIASGGAHLDPDTLGSMNAVVGTIRDIVLQGQREGRFRLDVDPLLAHLTITPAILIFFARHAIVARRKDAGRLGAPITIADFVAHITATARGMLRHDAPGGGT
jgi:AcrR family transcriptional regulator